MRHVRWAGEADRYWGPFTYAAERRKHGYRALGIVLTSGKAGDDWDERRHSRCYVRIHLLGHTLIAALPQIIKPHCEWKDITTEPTRSQIIAQGRKPGYWDVDAREFGFTFTEGALHYSYGRQSGDSTTDRSGVWFLPWRGHRHIRHSLYDLRGEHWVSIPQDSMRRDRKGNFVGIRHSWDARNALTQACPSVQFEFDDIDGERLVATTRIEEREWLRGTGWFRWLSWFTRPNISRSLDIRYSGEQGREKGSWKGGTIGTSIEMLPGELHEEAFRRHCARTDHGRRRDSGHPLTYIGRVEPVVTLEAEIGGAAKGAVA